MGAPHKRENGLSSVTISNDGNDTDEVVKLVSIEPDKTEPVRQFFIPAYSHFTVSDVGPGKDDVRFKNLNSGVRLRTPNFKLEQVSDSAGVHYKEMTMTLYGVPDGKMRTQEIPESEFDLPVSP